MWYGYVGPLEGEGPTEAITEVRTSLRIYTEGSYRLTYNTGTDDVVMVVDRDRLRPLFRPCPYVKHPASLAIEGHQHQ